MRLALGMLCVFVWASGALEKKLQMDAPKSGDTARQERTPFGIRYATTAANWSQLIEKPLAGGVQTNVTLTPCPVGVDTTSGAGYQVLLTASGNSEATNVLTGPGGCTSGALSGTITFTPYHSYAKGSTIGSASSGIQEALNDACGVDPTPWKNGRCNVTVAASGPVAASEQNIYKVPGTIYLHANQSVFSGFGVSLECVGRGPCLQVGDRRNSNDYANNTILGFSFRSPMDDSKRGKDPSYSGVRIVSTAATAGSPGTRTITTAEPHGFRVGDMVTILFTDNNAYWGDAVVTSVPSSVTFTYVHSGGQILSAASPGVVALSYEAVLDNAENTHFADISYDVAGETGAFNDFFDMWDDEDALIEHFNNNAISLNANGNWTGSFVFSAGNQGSDHQIAPVITLRDSNITANGSNGVTAYNSNGLYIENTIIQASGPWQVYSANSTGNYQGAYLKNIYTESDNRLNPLSPARSPFAGTGIAGLIAGTSTGVARFSVKGSGGVGGVFATGGGGTIPYSYFVVAKDATAGTQTSPMQVLNYKSTGRDTITVRWPRVANGTDVITYDLIRTIEPLNINYAYPYSGGCGGGATSACGSVVTQIAQCEGLVCTYTDEGSKVTTKYDIKLGTYSGNLIFWPGSIVTVDRTVAVDVETRNIVGVGLVGNPAQIAEQCSAFGAASPGAYTSCLASITTSNNSVPNQTGTLMTDGGAAGGGQTLSKGRLNFSIGPFAILQPHHIITLIDSQPALTRATWGYRPAANSNDTWIGTDVPSGGVLLNEGRLAFGAPLSITNYIAATGDGAHSDWLERLTAERKTFAVPVTIQKGNSLTLGDGSPLTQMRIYKLSNVPANRIPGQGCADIVVKTIGVTKLDQISGLTPPAGLGNLSVNPYPGDSDTVILHFCNSSKLETLTPSGTYSFLAVR